MYLLAFLLAILVIPSLSSANAIFGSETPSWSDYAGDKDVGKIPHVDGGIGASTCTGLNGTIVIGTINAIPVSSVALCEFHGYYFKLLEDKGIVCTAVVHLWKDPKTGDAIQVGGCIPPYLCNAPGSPGIYADNSEYADEVTNTIPLASGGNTFNVALTTDRSTTCSNVLFDQEEKKIRITSTGGGHGVTTISVPDELISGELKVLLNGNNTEFKVEKTTSGSTITVGVDYPRTGKSQTIDILGNQTVPEFPPLIATGLAIVIFLIITKVLPSKLKFLNSIRFLKIVIHQIHHK